MTHLLPAQAKQLDLAHPRGHREHVQGLTWVTLRRGRDGVDMLVAEGVKQSAAARPVAEEIGLSHRALFAVADD